MTVFSRDVWLAFRETKRMPPPSLDWHAQDIERRAALHWSCWSELAYKPGLLFDGKPQHGGQDQVHYAKQGYFLAAWLRNIAREQGRTPETAKALLQKLCAAKGREVNYLRIMAPWDSDEEGRRCVLTDLREMALVSEGADWLECARNIRLDLLSEWQRCVWRELWEYST